MKYSKKIYINQEEVIASLQNVGIVVEYGNSHKGVVAYDDNGQMMILPENYSIFSDESQSTDINEYQTVSRNQDATDSCCFQSRINVEIAELKINDQPYIAA